jgi:RHS repeat-associated protein
MTANDIYTIAGQGWSSVHFAGDGGPPLNAEFAWIASIAPGSSGGYYVADNGGVRIRYVSDTSPATTSTTTYTYNADGEQTSVTSPNGNLAGANVANHTTTRTYNAGGQVTASTQGGGTGSTVTARTTTYSFDGDGNRTSVTDPRGYTTNYTFNADDEETLTTNPLGNATLTCYDGVGNVAQTVPAIGVAANSLTASSCATSYPTSYGVRLATDATTTAYNALGEKTTVTTPAPSGLSGHETTTYAYDVGGRLTSETAPPTSTAGGAPNDVTAYTYDHADELTTTTTGYGTSTASTSSSCYDPNGNVTATVPGDGNTSGVATCATSSPYETSSAYQTGYTYDSLGETLTQTAPATSAAPSGQVTSNTYDPAGNRVTVTNPNGVVTTNVFTPLNQLASVSYSNATPGVTKTYDANGNMTLMTDGSGTTTNVYDPFDELTSMTNGFGRTMVYAYDLNGNVTGLTYPLGSYATWASTDTVTYTYDHADQLSSITDFNGHTSNVTNTADGLPATLSLGSSGDTVTTTYAANDAPSSISLGNGSTLQKFAYSNEPNGAIASETDTPSSSLSPAAYTYNAQSQLTQDTPGTGSAKSYTQDASSNMTTLSNGASATYDHASELTSSALSGTTTSYTYNANGNRTGVSVGGSATVTASYNGANQLTVYSNAAANMSNATYDGAGLRASVTATPTGGSASTQHFVWDTVPTVPRLLKDSTNAYIYGPDGTPFEQVNLTSGTIQYLVDDVVGSVRGIVSVSGSLTASTSYDPWGNPQTSGGLMSYTAFGFQGGYTDSTGLVYLINRYYDPSTDQFLSIDPALAQTNQPYVFTNDSPLNGEDPLGLCWVVCSIFHAVSSSAKWVGHHPLETFGLVLGVAGAVTGVGAVIEIAAGAMTLGTGLGVASIVVGTGATFIDGKSCSTKNRVACVGAALGAVDIITGGIATFGGASAVSQGFGAFSASFGVAGSVFDVTITAATSPAKSKGSSKKSIKVKFGR